MVANSSGKKLIVFELNEVPFRVLDHFIANNPSSNLARLLPRADVFETFAEDEGHLSPWITWPTVHRGVTNQLHGLVDFGQDLTEVDGEYPPIWRLLAGAGVRTGVFGPLHSYPLPDDLSNYAFYVPDTFAAGPECFPENLTEFQAFNLDMVDASARNVSRGLMLGRALPFLKAAPELGLRARTMGSIALQLVRERAIPHLVCRRRTTQAELAFDIFLSQLRTKQPAASFFFTNHVASSLHRYWPGTFPEDYPTALWAEGYEQRFRGEINYTMSVADQMIGELVRFTEAHAGHRLLIATSMGQEAVPDAAQVITQLYCTDIARFMAGLGVPAGTWQRRRAMAPEYVVGIDSPHHDQFVSKLRTISVNGVPLRFVDHDTSVTVILGHANLTAVELRLGNERVALETLGLRNVEIQDRSASFAYHIPEGVLISFDPSRTKGLDQQRRRVSTVEIAPAILASFGVDRPSYMQRGLALA